MRKKMIAMLLACMLTISGISSASLTTYAANTSNRSYTFDNASGSGTSGTWQDKTDNTKVYVHPTSGPTLYYTVMGRSSVNTGAGTERSNRAYIQNGIHGSITNTVRESGNNQARLKLVSNTSTHILTKGVWSPDSTQIYTVFN